MTATQINAPIERTGWLQSTWEKVATVLAVIGLIDVSSQLIKWASLVHWIAEKYATVRTWLFGRLPFHIPPEWHDPIVLLLILFSVANVGFYRRTGHTIIFKVAEQITKIISLVLLIFLTIMLCGTYYILLDEINYQSTALGFTIGYFQVLKYWFYNAWNEDWISTLKLVFSLFTISLLPLTAFVLIVYFALLAWRWLLTTAAIFGVLLAINYAYVLWLEPLAEHH